MSRQKVQEVQNIKLSKQLTTHSNTSGYNTMSSANQSMKHQQVLFSKSDPQKGGNPQHVVRMQNITSSSSPQSPKSVMNQEERSYNNL